MKKIDSADSASPGQKMRFDTTSEKIFAPICLRHGYAIKKLQARPTGRGKMADFLIGTPCGEILAEVKELSPNEDDRRQMRELKEQGITSGGGRIGARARKAIRDASIQLRSYEANIPKLVVIYNNIVAPAGRILCAVNYLDPYEIGAAMYGDLITHVPIDRGKSPMPDKCGGNRTTTATEKRYLSAVAVISHHDDESLTVYHNYHATIPLPQAVFNDEKCYHLKKDAETIATPWTWKRLGVS